MAAPERAPIVLDTPKTTEGSPMSDQLLTMRMAVAIDAAALRRLARLDSTRPLAGRVLLAELDGTPVAAISLHTGAVVADPFRRTAEAVRMLKMRRSQLVFRNADVASVRASGRRWALPGAT
jgi:hypothetical protein